MAIMAMLLQRLNLFRNGLAIVVLLLGLKTVLFEKIVLEGQFESHCSQLDGRRRYCISYSARVQEIKDYGQPDQNKLPMDEGHGYIWRLYSLTKFEERDGGAKPSAKGRVFQNGRSSLTSY